MTIDGARLAALVPHAGAMRLIDSVSAFTDTTLLAHAGGHRDVAHPLRRNGRLASLHLAEYGAQAMAVHGGLLGASRGEPVAPGMLVALRDVMLEVERIDDVPGELDIAVTRLGDFGHSLIYSFDVSAAGRRLATGRATVICGDAP